MQVVVYPNDAGGVSLVYPVPEFSGQIQAIAQKDVPQGKPWRVVLVGELPPPEARDRWRWTDEGPLDLADPIAAVPQSVSRFQAKAALAMAGLLDQANAAVAASGDVVLQLAWAEATEFKRNSPGINALAPALGLDDAALDQLFITASGIVA